MIKIGLYQGWSYGQKASVTDLAGIKGEVRQIDLPHDAMLDQPRDPNKPDGYQKGYFPDGVYQYDKTLEIPSEWEEKAVYLEFEGVFRDAEVLLNKSCVKRWHYGYTGFTVCLDAYLKYGEANTLSVTAKSGREGHWYSGTGIYRPVFLMLGNRVHIAPNGIRITTVDADRNSAVVEVETTLRNIRRKGEKIALQTRILDAQGNAVGTETVFVTLPGNSDAVQRQRIFVNGISRWSVESPTLYTCESRVLAGEEQLDESRVSFGIRTISVDAGRGFRLNGVETKLRGVCIHHDAGPIGAATYKDAERRRIRKLKAAGINAVRMAHNPCSRALLEVCDEEGMLVMDEAFAVWDVMRFLDDYTAFFADSWQRDVEAMTQNAYNHPSVVMYSIGNEIQEIITPAGADLCRRIADYVHRLDPTRFTTLAINGMVCVFSEMDRFAQQATEGGDINQAMVDVGAIMSMIMQTELVGDGISECADCVDIAGYNYMQARYEIDAKLHPNRVIVGSETHPREIDVLWDLAKKHTNIIGDFTWTGWNYLGEAGIGRTTYGEAADPRTSYLGEHPWIGSDCGDFDMIGDRKPISFFREIVYGLRKTPYITVLEPKYYGIPCQESPWGWADSYSGWSWKGFEGNPVQVAVCADAEEVVLLCNGKELGHKPCGKEQRYRVIFDTVYEPGELRAVALRGGEVLGTHTLNTAGEPGLYIRPESPEVTLSDEALIYVSVSMEDGKGRTCHWSEEQVTLDIEGPARLLGFGNGSPITEERYDDCVHSLFQGRAVAILRPMAPGTVLIHAASASGQRSQCAVTIHH